MRNNQALFMSCFAASIVFGVFILAIAKAEAADCSVPAYVHASQTAFALSDNIKITDQSSLEKHRLLTHRGGVAARQALNNVDDCEGLTNQIAYLRQIGPYLAWHVALLTDESTYIGVKNRCIAPFASRSRYGVARGWMVLGDPPEPVTQTYAHVRGLLELQAQRLNMTLPGISDKDAVKAYAAKYKDLFETAKITAPERCNLSDDE